jgi:DNA-binding NtrC family response regulator
VDVRVLASTNRDLKEKMAKGEFREDLFYRLNVISLHLPALRERPEDIPLLTAHFLEKFALEYKKSGMSIGPDLVEELNRMEWPGNVRELENTIRRAVILCRGPVITSSCLGNEMERNCLVTPELRNLPYREAKKQILNTFNRDYLSGLLAIHKGNVTRAAGQCGLERQAFQQLLRRYGLKSENFRN